MYFGKKGQLEFDFVLSPGANPRAVRFRVTGARKAKLNASGDLLLEGADGAVEVHKPTIYQKAGDATRRAPVADFSLSGNPSYLPSSNFPTPIHLLNNPTLL